MLQPVPTFALRSFTMWLHEHIFKQVYTNTHPFPLALSISHNDTLFLLVSLSTHTHTDTHAYTSPRKYALNRRFWMHVLTFKQVQHTAVRCFSVRQVLEKKRQLTLFAFPALYPQESVLKHIWLDNPLPGKWYFIQMRWQLPCQWYFCTPTLWLHD